MNDTKIRSWAVGHNSAGYLPNPDNVFSYADRAEAVTALVDLMRDYADSDDEQAAELLPADPANAVLHGYEVTADGIDYGDDYPAMRATVDSILADAGPDRVPGDWSAWVEEWNGTRTEFWIMGEK